jgi:hypothetical protein
MTGLLHIKRPRASLWLRPNLPFRLLQSPYLALWIVQGLLAALFLFAGGAKLVLPLEMAGPPALPGWFLRFIGAAPYRDSALPSVLRRAS